jgi:hypothetical protein
MTPPRGLPEAHDKLPDDPSKRSPTALDEVRHGLPGGPPHDSSPRPQRGPRMSRRDLARPRNALRHHPARRPRQPPQHGRPAASRGRLREPRRGSPRARPHPCQRSQGRLGKRPGEPCHHPSGTSHRPFDQPGHGVSGEPSETARRGTRRPLRGRLPGRLRDPSTELSETLDEPRDNPSARSSVASGTARRDTHSGLAEIQMPHLELRSSGARGIARDEDPRRRRTRPRTVMGTAAELPVERRRHPAPAANPDPRRGGRRCSTGGWPTTRTHCAPPRGRSPNLSTASWPPARIPGGWARCSPVGTDAV